MERLKVAVIFGGMSPEHGVSLQSAGAVVEHISKALYETIPVGITRGGRWFRYRGDPQKIKDGSWETDRKNLTPALLSPDRAAHGMIEFLNGTASATRLDAVFPVLHGAFGEDGTVQGLTELSGIPLVGCGTLASAAAMDKITANRLAAQAGIESPEFLAAHSSETYRALLDKAAAVGYPLFVKPSGAGSSLGISKVCSVKDLQKALDAAFAHGGDALLEKAVDGVEIGCAVMGNRELTVGEVDEIELQGDFFDFFEKYNLSASVIHLPARIDSMTKKRAVDTAAAVYRALGCRVFARVDLFLTRGGKILFNEVNTIPGFTAHSRFPNMMKGIGFGYSEILGRLISLGMEDAKTETAAKAG